MYFAYSPMEEHTIARTQNSHQTIIPSIRIECLYMYVRYQSDKVHTFCAVEYDVASTKISLSALAVV